jgi:hypothetical protein
MVEGPTPGRIASITEKQGLDALDEIANGVRRDWDGLSGRTGQGMDPEDAAAVRQWFEKGYMKDANVRAASVIDAALAAADGALYDYRLTRRADVWLASVVPYPYYYTRTMRNQAIRTAAHPGRVGKYMRWKRAWERYNRENNRPDRMEGTLAVPMPGFAPDWAGENLYVRPPSPWPWESMMQQYNFKNPFEAETVVDGVYRVGQALGLRPFPTYDLALRKSGLVSETEEEMWNLAPQTAQLNAVSASLRQAGMNWIQPGGWQAEQWARDVLGMGREPAQTYRVGRAEVSALMEQIVAQEPDPQAREQMVITSAMALELLSLIDEGELEAWEAMGYDRGLFARKEPGTVQTERAKRIAGELGWSEEELRQAQALLGASWQRGAMERAVTTMSKMVGMPTYMMTQGEDLRRRAQQQQRGQMYSPLTQRGSREQYMDWREGHPEAQLFQLPYELLPGAEERDYGPQETINAMRYYDEREQLQTQHQSDLDAHILANPTDTAGAGEMRAPTDTAGAGEMRAQQYKELAALSEKYGMEGDPGRLWSIVGATPEEEKARRQEQLLSVISQNVPRMDEFVDPTTGEPDYTAYEQALEGYYWDAVGGIIAQDPAIQKMVEEAGLDVQAMLASELTQAGQGRRSRWDDPDVRDYLLDTIPFTAAAKKYMQDIDLQIALKEEFATGGGYWNPTESTVATGKESWEATVHELAHAWWHKERQKSQGFRDQFLADVDKLADETDPRYSRAAELARVYFEGEPGFEQGMSLADTTQKHLDETVPGKFRGGYWNDWEIFAGLASGTMADVTQLPPYMRKYYDKLYEEEPNWVEVPYAEGSIEAKAEHELKQLFEQVGLSPTGLKVAVDKYRRRNDSPAEAARRYGLTCTPKRGPSTARPWKGEWPRAGPTKCTSSLCRPSPHGSWSARSWTTTTTSGRRRSWRRR